MHIVQEWKVGNCPDFSEKHQQPPNSPDLNSFDYHISGAMPRQKSAAKAEDNCRDSAMS